MKTQTLSIQLKVSMSEENKTPTRQLVEVGDVHHLGESSSEVEDNFQSHLLERRMSSIEVDRRINAIVPVLATQLETLIQSVREISGRSSNRLKRTRYLNDRDRRVDVPTLVLYGNSISSIYSSDVKQPSL